MLLGALVLASVGASAVRRDSRRMQAELTGEAPLEARVEEPA
jgi:hypothetical protein